MFELNLIKDKAKARQRRRVIFMSIMLVMLLCGLVSLFVGSMIWTEQNDINWVTEKHINLEKQNTTLDNDLKLKEPAAIKRLNALVRATEESERLRNKRMYFAPALRDLFMVRPDGTRFWYTAIDFAPIRPAAAQGGVQPPVDLTGYRSFSADGHVQILLSDVKTQQALERMSADMRDLAALCGQPSFTSQPDQGTVSSSGAGGQTQEEERYIRFSARAMQQYYTGGTGTATP
jgi:hypothetical protein